VLFGERPVRPRVEGEIRFFARFLFDGVVVLARADGHARMRQVGDVQQQPLERIVGVVDLVFERADLLLEFLRAGDVLLGLFFFARAHQLADLAGAVVPFFLRFLQASDFFAPLFVEAPGACDGIFLRITAREQPLRPHRLADPFGLGADQFDVDHSVRVGVLRCCGVMVRLPKTETENGPLTTEN
jgi:hypothetical protein